MSDKTEKILMLAALGLGAFFLFSRSAGARVVSRTAPPGYANGTNGNTAPTLVGTGGTQSPWYQLGGLIGSIFRGGSASTGPAGNAPGVSTAPDPNGSNAWNDLINQTQPTYDASPAPLPIPDDSIAANPPGNVDPYAFEAAAWNSGI